MTSILTFQQHFNNLQDSYNDLTQMVKAVRQDQQIKFMEQVKSLLSSARQITVEHLKKLDMVSMKEDQITVNYELL